MRGLILGALTAVIAAVPALAADIPARRPVTKAPPPAATVYNWTGFYTATSVGGVWWDIDGVYVTPPPDQHRTEKSKAWYGSHVGAQYQWGNVVLGVEASHSKPFSDDYGSSLGASADCLDLSLTANRTCESRIRDYWTVGGKLGFAFNNWLIYGTGGYANGRIQTQTLATSTGAVLSFTSARHPGWFAGAGVDVFITKFLWSDLILGVEYQHVEFDNKLHVDIGPTPSALNNRNVEAAIDSVRAKFTFKY